MIGRKSPRLVARIFVAPGALIGSSGMVGLGILFQHHAHRSSSWSYWGILLGYVAVVAGVIGVENSADARRSPPAGPRIFAAGVLAALVVALGLGILTRWATATNLEQADSVFGIGILLMFCAASFGTALGCYLMWRQRRDGAKVVRAIADHDHHPRAKSEA